MSATLAFALMLSPQAAPSDADLSDAKCVAAMALLREEADAKDKPNMQSAMLFFAGKIAGRSGAAAVTPALKAAAPQVRNAGAEGVTALAEQCIPQISVAAQGM